MADYNFSTFDYLQLDFPDEDYTYAQVEDNREDVNLNQLFRCTEQADNYGLIIGDFTTEAANSFGYVKTYTTLLADLARSDTLFLVDNIEAILINVVVALVDELKLSIDGQTIISVVLSRTDFLLPEIIESISSAGTMTASDILLPRIIEAIASAGTMSASDTLLPKIDEIIEIFSSLSRSDILLPKLVDIQEILWYILRNFRFREDDGSESAASWLAGEGVDINRSKNLNTRLRVLFDTNSDSPSLQLRLQYRPVGDPDWEWRDIL